MRSPNPPSTATRRGRVGREVPDQLRPAPTARGDEGHSRVSRRRSRTLRLHRPEPDAPLPMHQRPANKRGLGRTCL